MIEPRIESRRGCGYRIRGGIYLVAGKLALPCYKLPVALTVCPCCGQGVQFSRGYAWISGGLLEGPCTPRETGFGTKEPDCSTCVLRTPPTRLLLSWVGQKFYARPADFTREAAKVGISRRIGKFPKGFVVGETWVALAHAKAIETVDDGGKVSHEAGVFALFCPTKIEYVVKGTETPEELESLAQRGFTFVDVVKDTEAQTSVF